MDIRRNAIKVAAVGLLAAAGGLALGSDRFVALAGHLEDAVDPDLDAADADASTEDAGPAAHADRGDDPPGHADAEHPGA